MGLPGKRVFQFLQCAQGGESIDIWADAGCNDLFGELKENGTIKEAAIAICHDELRNLYYDFEVLLDFLNILPEDTARHQQILSHLSDAASVLQEYTKSEAIKARKILANMLCMQGGDPSLTIYATGHAHIDLAWLWPIRETWRKGARTFATVLDLMNRYPDYLYGASQPQLFSWTKEHYPILYKKIKTKVEEGRIEPHGAMWVEADTNISGGEALIRQILLGKQWFKNEFGIDVRYLWLPDVFGYSAALPQILKKSDIDYFMTQKLSWNNINNFPYHSFHWQGLDGTSILAHMLPEETYNSQALPHSINKIEKNYNEKDVSDRALLVFGIGDGGGGPGAEHLERLERLKNLAGLCPVKQESAMNFFKSWAKDAPSFPTWVGELYLERHQGTFTTQALIKWYNRRMEIGLRELEWASVLAGILINKLYPATYLENIWKEVLLYQFHDILPGSSIKRVYDECLDRYRIIHQDVTESIQKNYNELVKKIDTSGMEEPVVIFNSLSWERREWLHLNSKWFHVTVPSMGYRVIDTAYPSHQTFSVIAKQDCLENDLIRVLFNDDGTIQSIYDKQAQRQVIEKGKKANQLMVFKDTGDAWDFPMDYANHPPQPLQLVSIQPEIEGPRAILKQTYILKHCKLEQEIVLTNGSRRLDFITRSKWLEPQTMLRTSFPVSVYADDTTFDIQFGTIRRPTHQNTSWDLAKDEVPAQKWADLSQRDYGVALLNDCKYGYRVKKNVIDLNLIRSVPYPGPRLFKNVKSEEPNPNYTDQCDHIFSYALYPHVGDQSVGRVAQAGYEFNIPLVAVSAQARKGEKPDNMSFLQVDAANVILETVKRAEDGHGIIIRFYESQRKGCRAIVTLNLPIRAAEETNLMEKKIRSLQLVKKKIELDFAPFEIKTIRIVMKQDIKF